MHAYSAEYVCIYRYKLHYENLRSGRSNQYIELKIHFNFLRKLTFNLAQIMCCVKAKSWFQVDAIVVSQRPRHLLT